MLSNDQIKAIKIIASAADRDCSIIWVLTGSTSFALQGMTLDAHDIDVQTDEESAYKLETQSEEYVVQPVCFCGTEKIRPHFGRLKICGVDVEIMGDIQKRLTDGLWEEKISLLPIIQYVYIEDIKIPAFSLAYEAEAYRKMGRTQRADEIERFLTIDKA